MKVQRKPVLKFWQKICTTSLETLYNVLNVEITELTFFPSNQCCVVRKTVAFTKFLCKGVQSAVCVRTYFRNFHTNVMRRMSFCFLHTAR